MECKNNLKKITETLSLGGVAVMPTDTIYGILSSALNPKSVETVFHIKKRDEAKPFIILISSLKDMEVFNISINEKTKKFLNKIWPGKVSVILDAPNSPEYLHRGSESLAFRIPDNKCLIDIIKKIGPLTAPSANPEGFNPAQSITQAKKYFGERVDLYIDGEKILGNSSTLIKIKDNKVFVLRRGDVEIDTSVF